MVGALLFGRLTDTLGRKKLFVMTLALYPIASGLAAFSPNVWIFLALRLVAGMGIGGEYSAVNSAVDELILGRFRGRVDRPSTAPTGSVPASAPSPACSC